MPRRIHIGKAAEHAGQWIVRDPDLLFGDLLALLELRKFGIVDKQEDGAESRRQIGDPAAAPSTSCIPMPTKTSSMVA